MYFDPGMGSLVIQAAAAVLAVCGGHLLVFKGKFKNFLGKKKKICWKKRTGEAALLTLKIHRRSLRHGMILKDASAYNIQFKNGNPILIDTLSFEFYEEGAPWEAYGQFCRHFLAPLLLMQEKDLRMNRLLSLYIDGIPLDLAASVWDMGGK